MKRDESPMNDSLEIFVRHIKRASFFAHEIQDALDEFLYVDCDKVTWGDVADAGLLVESLKEIVSYLNTNSE